MKLQNLKSLKSEELDKLFIEGVAPSQDELQGFFAGIALPQTTKTFLPRAFEKFAIFVGDKIWKGKVFMKIDGEIRGANILTDFKIPAFPFKVEESISFLDGKPCFVLNYRVFPNPFPVVFIRDEVRKIGERLYLGVMFFYPVVLKIPSIYFGLEKI
ncbi:MAG: hypothetical protein RRA63_07515 [Candidatus Calescibacterium sp.]|jgi:hypothetical protein|nr:hypothetical protein [Candidatus Calescibacterium sp.]